MPKKNKHTAESEHEDCSANSDNMTENKKYIKRLELQCFVLNKIVNDDLNSNKTNTSLDSDIANSN